MVNHFRENWKDRSEELDLKYYKSVLEQAKGNVGEENDREPEEDEENKLCDSFCNDENVI